jgi:3-demethoxyubiquinol 3-hydroxylase
MLHSPIMRDYNLFDEIIISLDQGMRTIFATPDNAHRPSPAAALDAAQLLPSDKKHIAGLMRVNHTGEIAAQALYAGQAIGARDEKVRQSLRHAAYEEGDHLNWCRERLDELGSHRSYLDPLWFSGSFMIGLGASLVSDEVSLGFVIETERQVMAHLESHLTSLPQQDKMSQAIIEQMFEDESQHATAAELAGGVELPDFIKGLMTATAKVMTTTAYYV